MNPIELNQAREDAAQLIMSLEGFRSHAYLDSNNVKTIGYGSTIDNRGYAIKLYDTCTREQARAYLDYHMKKYVYPQLEKFGGSLPPKIYGALCSLLYNVGSLGPKMREALFNKRWGQLPELFREYDKIKGIGTIEGLKNRREKEIAYFSESRDEEDDKKA